MTAQAKPVRAVPVIDYPQDLVQWKKKIDEKDRLLIMNPEKFPKEDILRGLGLTGDPLSKSFGITDIDEINSRQAALELLTENPDLRALLQRIDSKYELPLTRDNFLVYYNPEHDHNPYWEEMRKLLSQLERAGELPPRVKSVADIIKSGFSLEDPEREMAAKILDQLGRAAILEGLAEVRVNAEFENPNAPDHEKKIVIRTQVVDSHIHGYTRYKVALRPSSEFDYPKWARYDCYDRPWWAYLITSGVRWWCDVKRKYEMRHAYQDSVITELCSGLKEDIEKAIQLRLSELTWNVYELDGATAHVDFSYSDVGLSLAIVGVSFPSQGNSKFFTWGNYEGYSGKQKKEILKAQTILQGHRASVTQQMRSDRLYQRIIEQMPNFFNKEWSVESPATDARYRWSVIRNLYESSEFKEIYEALCRHQGFMIDQLSSLKEIAHLADKLVRKADELKTPMCFKRIGTDLGSPFHFESILPIHLLTHLEASKLKPICWAGPNGANGNMTVITGANGGGKSVALDSVESNTWIYHSGLPIFGEGFTMNRKRILGSVSLDNGDLHGSTFENLLLAHRDLIRSLKKVDGREAIVILDEVGTGTQEDSGYEVGKRLLDTYQMYKATIVFSTQITDLAEHARDKHGACCYKIDPDHKITSGIGDGQVENLLCRTKLDRLLVK